MDCRKDGNNVIGWIVNIFKILVSNGVLNVGISFLE